MFLVASRKHMHLPFLNLACPVGYALSLSIMRGGGEVVTRFVLLLSADAVIPGRASARARNPLGHVFSG